MKINVKTSFSVGFVAICGLALGWSASQANEASVAGIYSLTEVDGERLPAAARAEAADGERCEKTILEGALLLDSEGRSAAFLTERVTCPSDSGSEAAVKEHSVIFVGSYSVASNQITIEDDFGTDQAVLKGDILVYESGGEGRPVTRFLLKKK